MQHIQPAPLQGVYILTLPAFTDERGVFIKSFHAPSLIDAGIDFKLRESYYSISKKDVIRGMHFQVPPYQLSKFVFCPHGAILDVIIDLRKSSVTYGQHFVQVLSAENHCAIFIPEGFAHGFKALTDNAITYYLTSTEYNKAHDTGVHVNTIGFDWGIAKPDMSQRDASFMSLKDFDSPFI
jgi:dTDP-4-dehydrorhamnose 3,5-epimerase